MRKFWSLTIIFFKTAIGSSMSLKIGGKESKWAGIALWVIIAISLAPMLWLVYNMMSGIFAVFTHPNIGELSLGVGFILNIGALMVFVFSLLAAPALFYFAKDVEYVLPLPLKPAQIIGAKFTMALAFEYILALALMATMFVALRGYLPDGMLTFNTIATFLALPILPMVYSTVLVMLIMRVTRFGRNPDKYAMFVGILAIVVALGFSMFAGQAFMVDGEALVEALNGAPMVMTTLNTVFVSNWFASQAFEIGASFGTVFINQLINVAIAAAAIIVFFFLAKILYFAGIIGISESGAPSKKMTLEDISKNTKSQGQFSSYLSKEFKLLLRSPVAFINGVLGAFIMPIVLIIALIPLMRTDDLGGLMEMVNFSDPRTVAAILAVMCAVGFIIGGMVSITCTSISREGKNLFIMKYLPISYTTQLNAKAASGFVILLPALLFMIIPMQILFQAPAWIFICGLLLALPGAIFINYIGLYIDLLRPKLTWDNENAAVKQNLNAFLLLIVSWSLAFVIIIIGIFLLNSPWVALFGLLGGTGLLAYGAYYLAIVKGPKLLERLH